MSHYQTLKSVCNWSKYNEHKYIKINKSNTSKYRQVPLTTDILEVPMDSWNCGHRQTPTPWSRGATPLQSLEIEIMQLPFLRETGSCVISIAELNLSSGNRHLWPVLSSEASPEGKHGGGTRTGEARTWSTDNWISRYGTHRYGGPSALENADNIQDY